MLWPAVPAGQIEKLLGQVSEDSPDRGRVIRELDGYSAEAYARQYLSSGPALELAAALCRAENGESRQQDSKQGGYWLELV